jgi:hypothetical protein
MLHSSIIRETSNRPEFKELAAMQSTVIEPRDGKTKSERPDLRQIGRDSLKGLFKVQNILLDYTAEQNAIAFKMVRERLNADESSPTTALIDSVEEIFDNVVSMQKSIVDMGAKRVERAPAVKNAEPTPKKERRAMREIPLAELLRTNFENTVDAQREILALLEKQGKLGVETADQFARSSAGRSLKALVARAKEAIDNVIATQGNLIELGARQGKDSLELLSKPEKPVVSDEFVRHAEEGIDNLRRTQEKLLEIASDLNEKAYGETADAATGEMELSRFAQRLEQGIERAVKAQNEMLDAGVRAVNRKKRAATEA